MNQDWLEKELLESAELKEFRDALQMFQGAQKALQERIAEYNKRSLEISEANRGKDGISTDPLNEAHFSLSASIPLITFSRGGVAKNVII